METNLYSTNTTGAEIIYCHYVFSIGPDKIYECLATVPLICTSTDSIYQWAKRHDLSVNADTQSCLIMQLSVYIH